MRILKLYIENFKGVKNSKTIDFSQSLVILRGPNGFGKTTIFDAIELCVTGSIKRIIDKAKVTNDSKDYSDAFYRNSPNKDVKLKLLIENEKNERITIVKYLPFNHDGNFDGLDSRTKKYKVIDSLEKLPTYILSEDEFDDDSFSLVHKPDENYEEKIRHFIFGENSTLKIKDIYKLFGYMQQDENTFYLELSETKRRDELDFLYNSQDQSKEVDELAKTLDQLKKAESALDTEIENLNVEQKISVNNALIYERVFTSTNFEFDEEDPFGKDSPKTIDANYRNTIDYIRRIKQFTDIFDVKVYQDNLRKKTLSGLSRNVNFQHYLILKNLLEEDTYRKIADEHTLLSWINETSIIQYYILQNFLGDAEFNRLNKSAKSYNTAQNYLALENVTTEAKLKAIMRIDDNNLLTIEKKKEGTNLLERLEQGKRMLNQSSEMLTSMDEIRRKLTRLFERTKSHAHLKDSECPLCGYDWSQYEDLQNSITKKDNSLNDLSKNQTEVIAKLNREIDDDYIASVETNLKAYVAQNERGYKFYKKLENLRGSVSHEDFEAFTRRLESVFVDAKTHIWTNFKTQTELDASEQNIKSEVSNTIFYDFKVFEKLSELKGYNFGNGFNVLEQEFVNSFSWSSMGTYEKLMNDEEKLSNSLSDLAANIEIDEEKLGGADDNFFKDVFFEKAENIELISPKLEPKIDYVNFKYNQKKNIIYELLDGRRKKIKVIRTKVGNLRTSYRSAINDYKNTMTDAIKIPFHIYSARILQNYSQGYGAFIDTPSQSTSSIRFSAGGGSDHDLVHQLSSGQLAVVSMAFSLAINKVYGSASLRFLAIDDPVQELDALNVYSLIELLRSDFGPHYQLLLSTHDEIHADYMAYKFSLDERDVMSIKVQELFFPTRIYEQLS
ncbi:AAA family ATPase [Candidatus Saccharibacteria bacterium]|nr:AAA family ATPase [Candidatus Saccharibacteria bacterium]